MKRRSGIQIWKSLSSEFSPRLPLHTVPLLVFLLSGCLNKKQSQKGELRSITVLSRQESELEALLLKSMGFTSEISTVFWRLESSAASGTTFVPALRATVVPQNGESLRKVIPLYAQTAESQVKYSSPSQPMQLTDLLAPSFQGAVGKELRLNNASAALSSADALISLFLSESNSLKFYVHDKMKLSALLTDGNSFRSVGEIPSSSKPAKSDRRERNSGFAVGDLLLFFTHDNAAEVRHLALWLDHDIFFEALPLEQSILFRVASYAQILESLALRTQTDVLQIRMNIVRRAVPWTQIHSRIRAFKDPRAEGSAELVFASDGRAGLTSVQGMTLSAVPVVSSQE